MNNYPGETARRGPIIMAKKQDFMPADDFSDAEFEIRIPHEATTADNKCGRVTAGAGEAA